MRGGALQFAPSYFKDVGFHVLLNSNFVIRDLNYISTSLGYPGVLPGSATAPLSPEFCRKPVGKTAEFCQQRHLKDKAQDFIVPCKANCTMIHAELDRLQSCLNFALDTLRKEMDSSQLPPLSQYSSVEHPLDDPTTYLPSTALFEARRLSLACLGELKNLVQCPLDKRMDERLAAYVAVCTDTLIKTGIIDYLSDVPNPSQGVPAAELASKFELDSQKLVPILRCYAANDARALSSEVTQVGDWAFQSISPDDSAAEFAALEELKRTEEVHNVNEVEVLEGNAFDFDELDWVEQGIIP
ncbi:hypothetical protein F4604DRAFT_1955384 [Suillus subluteus]|nr:hypothetical protein F4604DRAFT_1955384 [Suillus subluteus]